MWTGLLSFFKGKVFSEAGSLLIPLLLIVSIFAIWNSDAILTKFGFETTATLKGKVATLEGKVATLEEANAKLTSDLQKTEQKGNIISDASSSICVFQQDTEIKTEDLKDRRKREADRINNTQYESLVDDKILNTSTKVLNTTDRPSSIQQNPKTEALSLNNIQALHEAYAVLIKGEQS